MGLPAIPTLCDYYDKSFTYMGQFLVFGTRSHIVICKEQLRAWAFPPMPAAASALAGAMSSAAREALQRAEAESGRARAAAKAGFLAVEKKLKIDDITELAFGTQHVATVYLGFKSTKLFTWKGGKRTDTSTGSERGFYLNFPCDTSREQWRQFLQPHAIRLKLKPAGK